MEIYFSLLKSIVFWLIFGIKESYSFCSECFLVIEVSFCVLFLFLFLLGNRYLMN